MSRLDPFTTAPDDVFDGIDLRGTRLATPWTPDIAPSQQEPDVVVRFEPTRDPQAWFQTLQAAIDHVVRVAKDRASTDHRYVISVDPGVFNGPVIVPEDAPPMDIRGAGPGKTILAADIDAGMTGREYAAKFRDTISASGANVAETFAQITARQQISTGNTAVLRIRSNDIRLSGLTIINTYACDRASAAPQGAARDAAGRFAQGQHQAVALMLDGADRVVVHDCAFSSFQDTLYLKSQTGACARAVFFRCDIEGDVDFIFGGATAYFDACTIRSRGLRTAKGWALAPSTSLFQAHGFVFHACSFARDPHLAPGQAFLGRQWFEGVRATPYGYPDRPNYVCQLSDHNSLIGSIGHISRPTLESVGKCILISCKFDAHFNPDRLWDDWASGAWTPRYRPVQDSIQVLFKNLDGWLPAEILADYATVKSPPWLSQQDGKPATLKSF